MTTPLSDERVVEIRQRVDLLQFLGFVGITSVKLYGADDIDALRNLIGEDVPALLAEVTRLRATGQHMGGALDALGEVIRNAVRLAADTGDHAAALREIAAYAQQAGVLDDLEPAGSPS